MYGYDILINYTFPCSRSRYTGVRDEKSQPERTTQLKLVSALLRPDSCIVKSPGYILPHGDLCLSPEKAIKSCFLTCSPHHPKPPSSTHPPTPRHPYTEEKEYERKYASSRNPQKRGIGRGECILLDHLTAWPALPPCAPPPKAWEISGFRSASSLGKELTPRLTPSWRREGEKYHEWDLVTDLRRCCEVVLCCAMQRVVSWYGRAGCVLLPPWLCG